MPSISLDIADERFPVAGAFTISRGSRTEIRVVRVTLAAGGVKGEGECVPYARYDETVESVTAAIAALRDDLSNGISRAELQGLLPAGAARNALDCAFWDLEAKQTGQSIPMLAGLSPPAPLETAFTLSLGTPESMKAAATKNAHRPLLKVKLGNEGDLERIEAVRAGAPASRIIVDANEGWTVEQYQALAPNLVRLGVALVEQPLPAGKDAALAEIDRPLPVCADESCHDRASLADLKGKYDVINVKLDKTGGLTEALLLVSEARQQGFQIMVGCMLGTSLAMAPGFYLGQGAEFVDLDAPLLLAGDRDEPVPYEGSLMHQPPPLLWG
ncbi:N-acetyl-D-Glu racemase DgcA [Rhizobium halophytocola]|uniref:Dipeptide epimerase n=1 Tax=Rhizobium halophytocola TaxID=735519 RepID=A0ABS4DSX1_9HYPH|nr:N-acetyl-D-Glu racemase DgcA [Rhizobium halophytocola]MBP1848770.1 L-alanine-DL-glutamate epimerase-like enolase superfamily enzyme [Rhizobium halophytocola]